MVHIAAKVLMRSSAGELILLRRRRPPYVGFLDLPGGTVEDSETPEEGLRRELLEELGIAVRNISYMGSHWLDGDDPESTLSVVYSGSPLGDVRNLEPTVSIGPESWDAQAIAENEASPSLRYALARLSEEAQIPSDYAQNAPVLLVQPFFPLGDKEAVSIPLGLAYIHASLVARSIAADVLDCSISSDYDRFVNLSSPAAEVVGIQFHSMMSWEFCVRTCLRLRRELPDAVLVAGGEMAHVRSGELLESGVVDYVVVQEGEAAFVSLVESLLARRSAVIELSGVHSADRAASEARATPLQLADLDSLPEPSITAFRWNEYGQWTLMTSRGCPFRCSYCSSAAFWDHSVRYHSVEWILAQMERLSAFGAKDVYIADDTFTLNRRRTRLLCERLANRPSVNWSCLTRVDCVDEPMLTLMAAAGCKQISFGFETANDETLQLVAKRASYQQAERTIEICRNVGIRTRVSVIIGLPGEGHRDVRNTIAALEDLMPNEVQLYALTPHDGTTLYRNLEPLGVRIVERDPTRWTRDVLNPVCETRDLSVGDISSLGLECMERLETIGYVNLSKRSGRRKIGAEYTVGTAFTPVQSIRPVSRD